jgi:diguanylate cyclase (GGDEF)-like protein
MNEPATASGAAVDCSMQQLRAEQVIHMCRLLPTAIITSSVLALVVAIVLWPTVPVWAIGSWLALLGAVSTARLLLAHRVRRLPDDDLEARLAAQHRLRVGALLAGITWGLASLLFFPTDDLPRQMFLAFTLAGITAGATTSMAVDRTASLVFQLPVILPLAARLLAHGGTVHTGMAIMVVVYGVYLLISVNRTHAQLNENIELRIDALSRQKKLHDSETRYRQLAHHDALTGLPNRHSLQTRLPELLSRAASNGTRLALLYLDLDHFKNVNDARGHACGDQLLIAVAERLRSCVRPDDLIVRMGGDEFIIVSALAERRKAVEQLAKRIQQQLALPFQLDGEQISVCTSIGVGLYPDDGTTAELLMKHADIALYQAKGLGRDNVQFFAADMSHNLQERVFLEQALGRAIEGNQLHVEYQPLVDLPSGRTIGLEALLRWQHPERGLMSPAAFIPIAEQCGLISALGEYVLRQVCCQLQQWQLEMVPLVPIAVNVSPRQFDQGRLAELLLQITSEHQIDPGLLQIEITESALMKHIEGQGNTLLALRSLGVKVSIDDFGTGYSSLAYLKHLPIDCLKIDRSFVRDMVSDSRDAAIVSAVVAIARSLGIGVVAEGVESQRQVEQLRKLGCDAAQGYLFHRPMNAMHCRELLLQLAAQPVRSDTLKLRVLRWVGGDARSA